MKKRLLAFLLSTLYLQSFALVLEDLSKDALYTTLANKKIGYYIGSFDPFHKGHEAIVQEALNDLDYCIVYPIWGGDIYKDRTNVQIRLEMLFRLYKSDPKVIVTKLSPLELQNLLTKPQADTIAGKASVSPAIPNTSFIGILGSDAALKTLQDKKKLSVFMRGIKIPEKYKTHSAGVVIALPVEGFIVQIREAEHANQLNGKIGKKPILATFNINNPGISSTAIREAIRNNEDVSDLVDKEVLNIIKHYHLYQN